MDQHSCSLSGWLESSMTYKQSLHVQYQDEARRSALAFLKVIFEHFPQQSVLEVGCGLGAWLQVAMDLQVKEALGVDGEWTDLKRLQIPRENFQVHDLAKPLDLGRRFSMTLSLEVAEHVTANSANVFVDTLVRH